MVATVSVGSGPIAFGQFIGPSELANFVFGCIYLQGTPLRDRQVRLLQPPEPVQETKTAANGCYRFNSTVSGKTFQVTIQGPVVP